MVALGLVLLVLVALLTIGVLLDNGGPVQAQIFGVTVDNVSVAGLFVVGLIAGAVAMLGLGLMLAGAARKRSKRVAAKREVRDVRGEREGLAEENSRLQAELDRSRQASTTPVPKTRNDGEHFADGSVPSDEPGRHRG